MACKKLFRFFACSDDEDDPAADSFKFEASQSSSLRLSRIAIDANKVENNDDSFLRRVEDPFIDTELFEFEDEECMLGSPSKKSRKRTKLKYQLAPAEAKKVLRDKLVKGWTSVIMLKPSASRAGKRASQKATFELQCEVVSVYLEEKSENTMAQRLSPVNAYIVWVDTDVIDKWPPNEDLIADYLEDAITSKSGKTKTKRLIEAMTFTAGVFQFGSTMRHIGESKYLGGLAIRALKAMPPRRKAIAFLFEFVCIMEVAIAKRLLTGPLYMVIGVTLNLIYFRARFNDPDLIIRFEVFVDRVEMQVNDTKTSKLNQEVIMMSPTESLTGLDWLAEYRCWRQEQSAPLEEGWPLMPALKDGLWIKSQAKNGDFNVLLNAGLQILGIKIRKLSHDCKATFLDAAVAYGLEKDVRYRLGYHVDAADRSLDSYAASNQLLPIKKLSKLIVDYREGDFDPDAMRKSIPVKASTSGSKEGQSDDEQEEDGKSEEGSEGSGAASDIEALAQAELAAASNEDCKVDDRWFENISNGKLHRGRYNETDVTACGNFVGNTLRRMASGLDDYDPTLKYCQNCFGKTEEKQREMVRRMAEPLECFLSIGRL